MLILAVEVMLDRFDQRISDRYKLIEFREEDNQAQIILQANYFIQITIPVMLGMMTQLI